MLAALLASDGVRLCQSSMAWWKTCGVLFALRVVE
jgi:hypothetical protein